MRTGILIALLCFLPGIADAATARNQAENVRVGVNRMAQAAVRIPDMTVDLPTDSTTFQPTLSEKPDVPSTGGGDNDDDGDDDTPDQPVVEPSSETCR